MFRICKKCGEYAQKTFVIWEGTDGADSAEYLKTLVMNNREDVTYYMIYSLPTEVTK